MVMDGMVHDALFRQSNKKAPGRDSISIPVIKALLQWDPRRIIALVSQCLCLGYYPEEWKVAKGVCIPKPGKKSYDQAKSFWVISLLSCLSKLIEKVMATLITDEAKWCNILHVGQFGTWRGRSAMDATSVLVTAVEEAWDQKKIAAMLMMDVKGAFLTVNHACLLHKIWQAKMDKNLIQWTRSFMSNRRVEITVNGDLGLTIDTNTGLPQGSPVSLVLFLLYIADLATLVESMVPGAVALSFIDDVTWIVEGADDVEVTMKLNKYVATCLMWAQDNVVCFEEDKTEVILFSQCREYQRGLEEAVVVGNHAPPFNEQVTRWLGFWLDPKLMLNHHHQKWLAKAKQQQARISHLCRH
jgi:hypothetical protein